MNALLPVSTTSPGVEATPSAPNRPVVAVIGNPNTGKTTLFNALTGLRQHVGNYPGATVEHKVGACALGSLSIELVDLPGTYSLAARSLDEVVAVDVLLGQQRGCRPIDAILVIADASNPDRNFYLISQLLEIGVPVVVGLNMMDVAAAQGIRVDCERLALALGVPVVGLCANKGTGLPELRAQLLKILKAGQKPAGNTPGFPAEVNEETHELQQRLVALQDRIGRRVSHVEAFRILTDRDGLLERRMVGVLGEAFRRELELARIRASSRSLAGEEVRARYAWVKTILSGLVVKAEGSRPLYTERIDRLVTHGLWGALIFAALSLLVFQSIFTWAVPLMAWIDQGFGALGAWVGEFLADGPLKSLICDGVIAGVGGVLVFLPQICLLFLFIAILEDCGYMARAAFLMDRLLSFAGLSGKSFIPMLSSFACAIPGIMATRTIENRRDRLTTILVAPLMSCSARLPVYTLMIAAFVPERRLLQGWLSLQGLTLFAMYALGILVAIPVALIVRKTLLRGEPAVFLMELPVYKIPSWRTIAMRVLDRGQAFVVRAGTIILGVSVIVWALQYYPHSEEIHARYEAQREYAARLAADKSMTPEMSKAQRAELDRAEAAEYLRQSYFGQAGRCMEPLFTPLGWDWRITMAAMASFPAREVVVSVLGTVFECGEDEDNATDGYLTKLRSATWENSTRPLFNLPVALSIMVFFALCSQCAATLAAIKRETNSWRWPLFSFSYMTFLAYVGALLVYQIAIRF